MAYQSSLIKGLYRENGSVKLIGCLKVHKHDIKKKKNVAETETLWSQGPVTRDF